MRFHSTIKNARLQQFFLDKKNELESPEVQFDSFISTARQFIFLRNVTEFNPSDIESKAFVLKSFFARGVESIHENINEEEVSVIMALYSFALNYKDSGVNLSFLEDIKNLYEKNFNRSLDKFIRFANNIDSVVPLLEPQHQKAFQFLKNDVQNILKKEQHTMSTIQKLKLVSFLMNFQLSDEEIGFLSECIEPVAKVW